MIPYCEAFRIVFSSDVIENKRVKKEEVDPWYGLILRSLRASFQPYSFPECGVQICMASLRHLLNEEEIKWSTMDPWPKPNYPIGRALLHSLNHRIISRASYVKVKFAIFKSTYWNDLIIFFALGKIVYDNIHAMCTIALSNRILSFVYK